MSDQNNTPHTSESKIAKALKNLRQQDVSVTNDITRHRHLSAINKALRPTAGRQKWLAVAAAAVLVAGGWLLCGRVH